MNGTRKVATRYDCPVCGSSVLALEDDDAADRAVRPPCSCQAEPTATEIVAVFACPRCEKRDGILTVSSAAGPGTYICKHCMKDGFAVRMETT